LGKTACGAGREDIAHVKTEGACNGGKIGNCGRSVKEKYWITLTEKEVLIKKP